MPASRSSSPGSSGSGSDISRVNRTVLLVDDSFELRAALGAALQNAGYEVQTAGSGLEALDTLRWGLRPCAILLDLQMPGMNGWDFRAEQKRTPALQAIPTIAMTAGQFRKQDLAEFFDCITKPIDLKLLEAMLRRC